MKIEDGELGEPPRMQDILMFKFHYYGEALLLYLLIPLSVAVSLGLFFDFFGIEADGALGILIKLTVLCGCVYTTFRFFTLISVSPFKKENDDYVKHLKEHSPAFAKYLLKIHDRDYVMMYECLAADKGFKEKMNFVYSLIKKNSTVERGGEKKVASASPLVGNELSLVRAVFLLPMLTFLLFSLRENVSPELSLWTMGISSVLWAGGLLRINYANITCDIPYAVTLILPVTVLPSILLLIHGLDLRELPFYSDTLLDVVGVMVNVMVVIGGIIFIIYAEATRVNIRGQKIEIDILPMNKFRGFD